MSEKICYIGDRKEVVMKLLDINNRGDELSTNFNQEDTFDLGKTIHPRPLLQRSPWQSLNGLWKFAFDDQGQCVQPSDLKQWTHLIEVPFAPESTKSGIGD